MDDLLYFYSASAQISFVMLGFWWAIVAFKHDEWMADPLLKRMSHYVSLHFLLPGTMSLVSLLAVENSVLWRSGFGIGGVFGAVAAVMSFQSARSGSGAAPARSVLWVGMVAVYVCIAAVAAGGGELTDALGLGERALVVEGMLVGLLLFLGAQFAWTLFSQSRRPVA
ncbi:MAG: hypothetical protein QOE93_112 [Actinomycetota bacterium]|jgi:hypothetical protein|nr:hypothetical protein [Actinomycetota bacterium]